MKYIYTETPIEKAATFTSNKLIEHLSKGERVLWLLSGGSGSDIAIEAGKKLVGTDLSNLVVSMTDERYGNIGHKDENWQQLLNAGFNLPGATLYRPLIGQSIQTTTSDFNDWLIDQIRLADYKFGIFGIGADGHTCGIKPGTDSVKSTDLATFIKSDFERITITFSTIVQIDEAAIQASGVDKKKVIYDLIYNSIPLMDQPAQILKTIPSSIFYTNNKREDL
jgi:6-phosphogluconolactonase/glucosamine-6-phosphate isomerase/deaminase